jgi:hypothetical protein
MTALAHIHHKGLPDVGPPPCDACRFAQACAGDGYECRAFLFYVSFGESNLLEAERPGGDRALNESTSVVRLEVIRGKS